MPKTPFFRQTEGTDIVMNKAERMDPGGKETLAVVVDSTVTEVVITSAFLSNSDHLEGMAT